MSIVRRKALVNYTVSLHCIYNPNKKEVEVYCNRDTDLCPKRDDVSICSKCTAFDSVQFSSFEFLQ